VAENGLHVEFSGRSLALQASTSGHGWLIFIGP
jgi:hypothetical protein